MLTAIALTPSAPVLVPELAGAASQEVTAVREGALRAARALPDRWIAIGVGADDVTLGPDVRGTFAGYGADVPVALGPDATAAPVALPLCALFAGWLRDQVNLRARVQVRVLDGSTPAAAALERGRALRTEIDQADEPIGVLIVADGALTLTQAAPGGYDDSAEEVQRRLDDALGTADVSALRDTPDAVSGRVAYQVLAGLAGENHWSATEFVRDAPYGVGYFAGVWTPA